MTGVYNGYQKTINYKNNYIGYKGDMLASSNKELYNGADLKLNEVLAINYSSETEIKDLQEEGDLFKLVDEADKGDHSIYTVEHTENGQIYKIYNPSRMNKDFYLDYTLEDMVVKHQDVAELAMYLFTDIKEPISNLEITIHIPKNKENLKIWTHGVEAKIKYIDQETLQINIKKIDKTFDFRLIFDNNIVSTNKKNNEKILEKINELEANLDLEAIDPKDEKYNQLREEAYNIVDKVENNYNRNDYNIAFEKVSNLKETDRLKTELMVKLMNIEPKIERKEEITKVILTSIITIWIIGLIIILYQLYKKYNYNLVDSNLDKKNPFKIGYLLRKRITNNDLVSSLLYLIEKDIITFDTNKQLLKKNKKNNLSASEEKLIKMLFDEQNKITLKEILYKAQEEFDKFLKNYSNWLNFATLEAENEEYYEDVLLFKLIGSIYCIGGIILGCFLINNDTYYSSLIIIVMAIIFLIYFILLRKRTAKGISEYYLWTDLKDDDIDENWYLVYANSLGFFKKKLKKIDSQKKYYADMIKANILLSIKKSYEARKNAYHKYSKVKLKR